MDKTVGVLGGGQLGRMFIEAANRLNIKVITLDAKGCPASQVNAGPSNLVEGTFKDPQAIKRLADQVDVLTIEIEHVDTDALEDLSNGDEIATGWRRQAGRKVDVQPHWETIRTIQDKYAQKQYLIQRGIPVVHSIAVKEGGDKEDVKDAVTRIGILPVMLKTRREAYDGHGNFVLKSESQIPEAIEALGINDYYVEEWADFSIELAVMVVKIQDKPDADWESATLAFPVVETIHEDSICKLVYCPPPRVEKHTQDKAQEVARKAVAGFAGKGVFGVEMFLLKNGSILINEIAPRPHNSGHFTMEACGMSQYEAHLRAILDLPIDPRSLEADRAATMLNILGASTPSGHLDVRLAAAAIPRAAIHMYGKGDGRPGRKMGHVTVTAKTLVEAVENIQPLINLVDKIRAERLVPGTKSALTSEPLSSTSKIAGSLFASAVSSIQRNKLVASYNTPQVALTMGSDSDLSALAPGAALLREFGISYESNITSAHGNPERMVKFAREAVGRGIKVIIAAAGGAIHLPGMIASCTSLPVIGVQASRLDGVDSLYNIVQTPKGCPVATVGVDNSLNAAQLAIRILANTDDEIKQKLDAFLQDQTDSVTAKGDQMMKQGIENYSWP